VTHTGTVDTQEQRARFVPAGLAVAAAALALGLQSPPAPQRGPLPARAFSSARAMDHVRIIAARPKPPGSAAHAEARDYIRGQLTALGLSTEVQEEVMLRRDRRPPYRLTRVENVLGRLRGTASSGAVLLCAHYDTVATSPGAGDDGAGVAILLETARALTAGPALRNDVVFLFDDVEETGLLGARAFVERHPWAKDVRIAINFDARGTSGPVLMFETGPGNGAVVGGLAAAAPHPRASSLFDAIYRTLPNTTSFSVFKEAGIAGLNFANIEGAVRYHTMADTFQALDEATLQHGGEQALSLARHFGGLPLPLPEGSSDVYFDVAGARLVRYPEAWTPFLVALGGAAFLSLLLHGITTGALSLRGTLRGLIALLAAAVSSGAVAAGVVRAVGAGRRLAGHESGLFEAALAAAAIGVCAAIFNGLARRLSTQDLWMGCLAGWLALLVAAGFLAPGGAYVAGVPLACGIVGAALATSGRARTSPALFLLGCVLAGLPGLLVVVPVLHHVFVALPPVRLPLVAAMAALLVGTLAPALRLAAGARPWALAVAASVVSAALLGAAVLGGGFAVVRPEANRLAYLLNGDTGDARWANADAAVSDWSGRPAGVHAGAPDLGPAQPGRLPLPELAVLEDRRTAEGRTIRMRVVPGPGAAELWLQAEPDQAPLRVTVDGIDVPVRGGQRSDGSPIPWGVRYAAVPQRGFEVAMELAPAAALGLRVVAVRHSLPADLERRPDRPGVTASRPALGDMSLAIRTARF